MSRNPTGHIPPGFVSATAPIYARLLSQMLDKSKRGGVPSINEVHQSANYGDYIDAGAPSSPVWKETEGGFDLPWRVVIHNVLDVPLLLNTWKLGEGTRYYYNPKVKWDFEYRSPHDVIGAWKKRR